MIFGKILIKLGLRLFELSFPRLGFYRFVDKASHHPYSDWIVRANCPLGMEVPWYQMRVSTKTAERVQINKMYIDSVSSE